MAKALHTFVGSSLDHVDKLAWFGFAADPPTLAHRAVVDAVLGSGLVEVVIVFPAGKLPYKSFVATDWQRAEMTEIWKAAAGFSKEVIVSRFDLQRDSAIVWIDLWKTITSMAPQKQHYLVVGSDQYAQIPNSWDDGEELLKIAKFIIVPREGVSVQPVYPSHILLDIEPIPGSSTEVRSGDFQGVDEKVKQYIEEEGIYK